jgi:putative polyhydroxyalkanoate system protein
MKLHVTRPHDHNIDEVRRRLVETQDRLRQKYRAKTDWVDDSTLSIGAPGVRGQIEVAQREVRVDLDLSAVLSPLRGRIEKELGRELDRVVSA